MKDGVEMIERETVEYTDDKEEEQQQQTSEFH